MIGRLSGIVVDQAPDGACIVEVNGVGYEVYVPLSALGRLSNAPEEVVLHVHTQMREDALTLYGFETLEDRTAFRTLLGVNGVGPRLALSILSSMNAAELADAIQRDDRARFRGVSGVGKKIVERLVLELKDKLSVVGAKSRVTSPARGAASTLAGPLGVVHGALVQMGYRGGEAELAVQKIEAHAAGKRTEELLREALSVLA